MRNPAVPQAGSSTVSFFFGSMIATMKSMMWRGVRNCPASPCEPSTESSEGVAQALGVVIRELVDDLEEGAQGLRVAIRQVGILEDVAEERRDARVLRHLGDGLGVEVQGLEAAEARAHQLGPAVA